MTVFNGARGYGFLARADGDDGIVRVKSAVPMSEAITRIKAYIASKGIKFFMEIDQSKLAADAGIKLRASTLLVFGNPPPWHPVHHFESECRPGLARPPAADPGRQWRRLGGLDRFRMDRPASQHQGPCRAVQDGNHGCQLHYLDDHRQVTTRPARRKALGLRHWRGRDRPRIIRRHR